MRDGRRVVSDSASSPPGSASFPRGLRLTSPKQFERVLRSASIRRRFGPVRIVGCKNDVQHPRLGLIVAKRVMSKAVQRNRAKRVIRDEFRHCQNGLPGYDLVVQVISAAGSDELRSGVADGLAYVAKSATKHGDSK